MNSTTIKSISQRWQIIGRIVYITEARPLRPKDGEDQRYAWQVVLRYTSKNHSNLIGLQVFEDPSFLEVDSLVRATFSVEAQPSHKDPNHFLNFITGHYIEVIPE